MSDVDSGEVREHCCQDLGLKLVGWNVLGENTHVQSTERLCGFNEPHELFHLLVPGDCALLEIQINVLSCLFFWGPLDGGNGGGATIPAAGSAGASRRKEYYRRRKSNDMTRPFTDAPSTHHLPFLCVKERLLDSLTAVT